ncbi:hypothetical protein GSI_10319 [Ganoderma sinense ZZ0214-1]|uniref:Uncharacterized protein n=1 Tax=Ganoderma sinense ZZ0214-1 TaxID=1077348 RepID=A0A2G8S0A5_9APHY|nr:hypothetical protein GSI_10319 [Ganoderma sinense ZZ0214-1]
MQVISTPVAITARVPISDIRLFDTMSSRIDGLPVELLLDIFLEYQIPRGNKDKSPFENVVERCQQPVTNWVPLMLVCRRFRAVILNAAILWSRLPVTNNLAILQQRLFRSQDLPLDLLFKGPCESTLPLILPQALRIRSIVTAPMFHIDSLPSLLPLLKLSLPALQRVHIDPKMSLDFDSTDWHKLRDVGPVLNETSHPSLRAVTSFRLLLPLKESGFWSQQLFHLDIRSQDGDITSERRDDVLAILRATPGLEIFGLTFPKHALPPDFHAQMIGNPVAPASFLILPPREPAPLPRLRILTLAGPAWLTGPILHDIDAPSLERLYIDTSAYPRSDTGDTIAAMFPERLCRLLSQHTRLHIHAAPSDKRGFRIGDCRCQSEAGRVSADMLYLRVQDDCGLYGAAKVLRRVFGEARLETLEVNYFERHRGDLYGVWRPVLETFPDLRKLTLYWNDQVSGAAMVDAVERLQKEGLNAEMTLVVQNAGW